MAESADVTIDFSRRTHYYNSGKAHQLVHWAEGYNQQQPLRKKQRVQQLALSSIPAFIIDESTLISGLNSVDYLEQALASLLE